MSATYLRRFPRQRRAERLVVLLSALLIATLFVLAGCTSAGAPGIAPLAHRHARPAAFPGPARSTVPALPSP